MRGLNRSVKILPYLRDSGIQYVLIFRGGGGVMGQDNFLDVRLFRDLRNLVWPHVRWRKFSIADVRELAFTDKNVRSRLGLFKNKNNRSINDGLLAARASFPLL